MLLQNKKITYGFANTRFGNSFLALVDEKICQLSFADNPTELLDTFLLKYSHNNLEENKALAQELADAIFERNTFPELYLEGTAFQQKVWRALLDIPAGNTTSYAAIASAIGHPKAVRAVGTAVGANPIAYIIPCHRVIRTDGGLGGYRWGLDVKKKILAFEEKRI